MKAKRSCDSCGRVADCACAKCNRSMCDDCTHCGELGYTCGLCKSREEGKVKYDRLVREGLTKLPFEEWYDQHG